MTQTEIGRPVESMPWGSTRLCVTDPRPDGAAAGPHREPVVDAPADQGTTANPAGAWAKCPGPPGLDQLSGTWAGSARRHWRTTQRYQVSLCLHLCCTVLLLTVFGLEKALHAFVCVCVCVCVSVCVCFKTVISGNGRCEVFDPNQWEINRKERNLVVWEASGNWVPY